MEVLDGPCGWFGCVCVDVSSGLGRASSSSRVSVLLLLKAGLMLSASGFHSFILSRICQIWPVAAVTSQSKNMLTRWIRACRGVLLVCVSSDVL